ncbi:hypothetical protein [Blastococcus atacamensis]|uniref:hypothetical protein n=1 Tax=Blastococcus atacamensis TaxID=2070508 RepID=UPI0012FFD594|nr:hypothetical protein [Blastococcus atacamensis]
MAGRAQGARWRWILAALVVVGVGAGAYWHLSRDALADPATVELPPQAAEPPAVREYFAGPGAPLLALLDQSSALPAETTAEVCGRIAQDLDAIGPPDALLAAAGAVPDLAVRDATVNHLDAVAGYLEDCGTTQPMARHAEQAKFTSTVLSRLLVRAGAR